MPRGRHRNSPPLHRLLPPTAIAGVSLVCALGPWVFTEQTPLRVLAAAAAATAVVGAVVMRRWDIQAGKQVADLTRAREGDEWRFEERVAELESDLDESRELRVKLEQRLRAKRAELAGLRNEHAALLRRYATAETERATALEGRRLLEIEAAPATPALPAARAAQDETQDEAQVLDEAQVPDETRIPDEAEEPAEPAESVVEADESAESADEEPKAPAVFSPEGSKLFLRAHAALARFDVDGVKAAKSDEPDGADAEAAQEDEVRGKPEAVDEHARAAAPHQAVEADEFPEDTGPSNAAPAPETDALDADVPEEASEEVPATAKADGADADGDADADGETVRPEPPLDRGPGGAPVPAPAPGPAAAQAAAVVRRPAAPVQRPSGHFAVPTAVAYVPAAQPVRRPTAEGGFDFFGTKTASTSEALDTVQNEDLADVVGQEALALHKAESEGEFKPLDEASRAVGQVIDLTEHDETEQIDFQGLRSAAS